MIDISTRMFVDVDRFRIGIWTTGVEKRIQDARECICNAVTHVRGYNSLNKVNLVD